MRSINNELLVKKQYEDDKNLSLRMNFHIKYSTNKYGYTNWMFDIYKFFKGCNILELGCGNGSIWENKIDKLPPDTSLLLSDISEGMLNIVRDKYKDYPNVSVKQINIQDIPYPEDSFDIIIANSMLYHIPDIDKAISEVYRVLRKEGSFYTTTTGNNGMQRYLGEVFKQFKPELNAFNNDFPFNLQNGEEFLKKKFNKVQIQEYVDSLEIPDTKALVDWISSTLLTSRVGKGELEGLDTFLENYKDELGIIRIPKEAGMFICKK